MGGYMGEEERETLGSSFTKLSLCYTNEELGYIWSTLVRKKLYWIETWPRWDKRYSIESKLCYSSSSLLSLVHLYSLREMVLNGSDALSTILFFFSSVPYFVDALVSQRQHNAAALYPTLRRLPRLSPSFVYWRRLSANMCEFCSINFIITYTYWQSILSSLVNLIKPNWNSIKIMN